MLTTPLVHPQMLAALARAGHGSTVLVADANYPASTTRGPHAEVVHLNLVPGLVDAPTIVAALARVTPIEAAYVMAPLTEGPYAMAGEPEVWAGFAAALAAGGSPVALEPLERHAFYAAAARPTTALVVVSGETRLYGNVILQIGVVRA